MKFLIEIFCSLVSHPSFWAEIIPLAPSHQPIIKHPESLFILQREYQIL